MQQASPAADAPPVCVARRKRPVDPVAGSIDKACEDERVLDALDRQASDIASVELTRFRLQDISTRQIDTLFSGCGERFHSLELEDCVMCERFFAHMSQRLAAGGIKLTRFRTARCRQAGMTALIALTGALTPALEELELSSCALARQAGIILGQSLQNCRALRRLLLSDNHLRDGGIRAIADGLRALMASRSNVLASVPDSSSSPPLFTGLELLDVSRNSISSTGLAALASVRTRTLIVADNAIDGVVTSPARALTTMVLDGGELRFLDLRGNRLSAQGIEEMASVAFHERTSLRRLDLSDCGLTMDAIEALQRGLLESSHCPFQELTIGDRDGRENESEREDGGGDSIASMTQALMAFKAAVEQRHLKLQVTIVSGHEAKLEIAAVSPLRTPLTFVEEAAPSENPSPSASPFATRSPTPPLISADSIKPSIMTTLETDKGGDLRLRPADVELIVSRTVESMNRNFDARIGQFLARMETQQHEKHTSQLQFLLGKVEACERAIPRLEARLDVLADRVASGGAQLAKLQSELQTQMITMRHEFNARLASTSSSSPSPSMMPPPPPPLLTTVMQTQVDELVAIRIRASEQKTHGELQKLRREAAAATATAVAAAAASSTFPSPLPSPISTSSTSDSQAAVLEAVSLHLSHFKRELDDKQNGALRDFTESIVRDGLRLEDRMARVEAQVTTLEGVVQAEQQASLLALEAISEAFSDATGASPSPSKVGGAQPQRRAR